MTPATLLLVCVVPAMWAAARAVRSHAARRLPVARTSSAWRALPLQGLLAPLVRARRWQQFDERLPEAVSAIARGLRSGASLHQALADAAALAPEPVGAPLREVVAATQAGVPLGVALDGWSRRCPRPNVLLLVAALSLAHDTGGASAQAVDGVAATLRRRQAIRAETTALATQARVSAYVLAAVPLVVCALTLAAAGGPARFLLGTPVGLACVGLGLSLEALGALWMVRLTRTGDPGKAAA